MHLASINATQRILQLSARKNTTATEVMTIKAFIFLIEQHKSFLLNSHGLQQQQI